MEETLPNQTDLSTYDSGWYKPGNLVKRVMWFLLGRLFINTYSPVPMAIKVKLLRAFGAKIGKGLTIKPKVNIKYPWFLEIGDYAWIGEQVWIDNLALVKLGSNVCLSQGSMVLTGNHDYTSRAFDLKISPVTLDNGSWIGARSVVCPGVLGASHSVLTAGSLISGEMEAYGVYSGNPAKWVKKRIITR